MTVKDNEKDISIHNKRLDRLEGIVVGNGKKGMDEIVREIEKRMGVVESDIKEVKRMMQMQAGYAGITYDDKNHPGRRESDKPKTEETPMQKLWTRTKEEIYGKFITAVIIALVLLVLDHVPEFFDGIANLIK